MVRFPSRMGYRVTVSYVGSAGAAKRPACVVCVVCPPTGPPSHGTTTDHKHSPAARLAPPPPSLILWARIKIYRTPDPQSQNGSISLPHLTPPTCRARIANHSLATLTRSLSLFKAICAYLANILVIVTNHPATAAQTPLCTISTYTQCLCSEPRSLRPLPQKRSPLPAHMVLP